MEDANEAICSSNLTISCEIGALGAKLRNNDCDVRMAGSGISTRMSNVLADSVKVGLTLR